MAAVLLATLFTRLPPMNHRSVVNRMTIVVALLVVSAAGAAAQTCMGTASFTAGRIRIEGAASFNDDANGLGASVSVGSPIGLFAQGSVARMTFDGAEFDDESAPLFGLQAGYAINV